MTKVELLEVGSHKISGETSMNPNGFDQHRAIHELSFYLNPFTAGRVVIIKATLGGFREPLYSVLKNFTSLLHHWSASDMPTILFSHLYEEATLCYCLADLIFEGKKEKRKRNTDLHDHSMRIRAVPADPGKSRLLVKSNLGKEPNSLMLEKERRKIIQTFHDNDLTFLILESS
ncbi:hypothetical protein NC652_005980 [Populus alba x Populus x berolinensis]|nr:hypothetical protein NC652_005980 [Populus alba x Populus x berolinensis]